MKQQRLSNMKLPSRKKKLIRFWKIGIRWLKLNLSWKRINLLRFINLNQEISSWILPICPNQGTQGIPDIPDVRRRWQDQGRFITQLNKIMMRESYLLWDLDMLRLNLMKTGKKSQSNCLHLDRSKASLSKTRQWCKNILMRRQ